MRSHSLYNYAFENPIRFVDADGMTPDDIIYLDRNGKEIYRVKDENVNKTYVVKTTQTTDEVYSDIPLSNPQRGIANPISKDEANKTEKAIKKGVLEGEHMKNLVELPDSDLRNQMMKVVSKDDGKGGLSEANNREYGGIEKDNNIVEVEPGAPADPSVQDSQGKSATIKGSLLFHSHSSGTKEVMIDGQKGTAYYVQPPSMHDINDAKGQEYTFGMNRQLSRKVYVYNNSGVVAIVPFSRWTKK